MERAKIPAFITLTGASLTSAINAFIWMNFELPANIPIHWNMRGEANLSAATPVALMLIPGCLMLSGLLQFFKDKKISSIVLNAVISSVVSILLMLVNLYIIFSGMDN